MLQGISTGCSELNADCPFQELLNETNFLSALEVSLMDSGTEQTGKVLKGYFTLVKVFHIDVSHL